MSSDGRKTSASVQHLRVDQDNRSRRRTAVGSSRSAAQAALKVDLAARLRAGGAGDSLNAGSPFPLLAEAWMQDGRLPGAQARFRDENGRARQVNT